MSDFVGKGVAKRDQGQLNETDEIVFCGGASEIDMMDRWIRKECKCLHKFD